MPPIGASVRTPQEILQAMHDRLDELARVEQAEWEAFAANPSANDPPVRPPERQQEIDSINIAMAHLQEVVDREEGEGGNEN